MRTLFAATLLLLVLQPINGVLTGLPAARSLHSRAPYAYAREATTPRTKTRTAAATTAVAADDESSHEEQSVATDDDTPITWRWIEGSGRKNTWQGVLDESRRAARTRENVEVHVACDSAVQGPWVVFATVICVIAKGQAGRYFYSRRIEEKRQYPVLQTRLLREVQLSLDTATALTESDVTVDTVHCDSNTDPGCKSTEHTRMLIGYIQSMGCTRAPSDSSNRSRPPAASSPPPPPRTA